MKQVIFPDGTSSVVCTFHRNLLFTGLKTKKLNKDQIEVCSFCNVQKGLRELSSR